MDQGKTPQLTSTLVPVSQTAPEAPPAEGASAPQLIARNRRARSRASVRIAFYAHDTLGLGHTRRNLLIATALTRTGYQVDLLIIAGTYAATRFTLPPGADCLALPSLRKDIEGTYTARSLDMSLQEIIHLRSQAIWAALKSFQPDLLVVDNVPRGAAGELDLSLRKLTRRGTTRCVLGLRDVIDAPEVVQAQWEARDDGRAIADHFDRVWIYGDPRLHQTLPPQQREAAGRRVRYLGYFDPCSGSAPTRRCPTRPGRCWTGPRDLSCWPWSAAVRTVTSWHGRSFGRASDSAAACSSPDRSCTRGLGSSCGPRRPYGAT
jgi:hypothetical protein